MLVPNKEIFDLYNDVVKTHWNPETPLNERKDREPFVSVKEAIGDLPALEGILGDDIQEYSTTPFSDYQKIIMNKTC